MRFCGFRDQAPSALVLVLAVVGDPGLPRDHLSEAAVPRLLRPLVVPVVVLVIRVLLDAETGDDGAEGDDRTSRQEEGVEVFHLFRREIPETGVDDHQVRALQVL